VHHLALGQNFWRWLHIALLTHLKSIFPKLWVVFNRASFSNDSHSCLPFGCTLLRLRDCWLSSPIWYKLCFVEYFDIHHPRRSVSSCLRTSADRSMLNTIIFTGFTVSWFKKLLTSSNRHRRSLVEEFLFNEGADARIFHKTQFIIYYSASSPAVVAMYNRKARQLWESLEKEMPS